MRKEVRFAGFGGQGIVLAGHIAGKAATVFDDQEAVMTQSYGPEARGGASASELALDDKFIDYPLISQPDVTVILSQEAYERYIDQAKEGSTIILEEDLVESPLQGDNVYRIPFTRLAEEVGRRIVTNIVMLGAFTALSGLISKEAMMESVRTTVPPKTIELNTKAFETGYEYAMRQKEAS
jgi:2-oxoglutarate ferredoxin oxidoreductase subunit gamma